MLPTIVARIREPFVPEHGAAVTVDVIRYAHSVLMADLHPCAGELRRGEAYTCNGTGHAVRYYAAPDRIPERTDRLIEGYNALILRRVSTSPEADAGWFARLVAVLMLRFLTIHPFADGNGRTARLLCAFALRAAGTGLPPASQPVVRGGALYVTPFPVTVGGTRDAYIQSLIVGRASGDEDHELAEPRRLAALIVDGWLESWRYFRRCVVDGASIPHT